jgi:hypothetical protein
MSKLNAFLLASALTLVPASAFAEISLSDMVEEEASDSVFSLDVSSDLDLDIAQPGPRPRHGVVVHHRHYAPAPRPVVVHHYRTNVRPVHPVVVVEQPATVVVNESSESAPAKKSKRGVFGMGLRGVGLTGSSMVLSDGAEISSKIAGGIGFYFKLRPIRWISIELINDYMFGTFDNIQLHDFFKVPLVIGLRGHVFDYGGFDLYGAAAASVTFVSYESNRRRCDSDVFAQFGAQFGGGVSFIASGLEIGLDMRYTIEEAPDQSPLTIDSNGYYKEMGEVDQNKPIHGFLFSVNLGFAL